MIQEPEHVKEKSKRKVPEALSDASSLQKFARYVKKTRADKRRANSQ